MILRILHRSDGKPPRVTELKVAHAEYDVAPATEAKPSEMCPYQRQSPQPEIHAWEWSPNGPIPSTPKAGETGKESPPESFDALAARLNKRFDKLVADIEQMRKELGEAEERSERLRHKLLDNGALRG